MPDLHDVTLVRHSPPAVSDGFMLEITVPVDAAQHFSHGMLHDRISALVGQELQKILLEVRAAGIRTTKRRPSAGMSNG